MRPRRYVSPRVLTVLRPAFRYSRSRDAYILRGIGKQTGPVLREEPRFSRDPGDVKHPTAHR
jgi:hypothetical protein